MDLNPTRAPREQFRPAREAASQVPGLRALRLCMGAAGAKECEFSSESDEPASSFFVCQRKGLVFTDLCPVGENDDDAPANFAHLHLPFQTIPHGVVWLARGEVVFV